MTNLTQTVREIALEQPHSIRVFERFGEVYDQYAGLFWSHFQAAIEWSDAEMYLEGAVQNDWSVAQMRNQRWEAMGGSPELKPQEADVVLFPVFRADGAKIIVAKNRGGATGAAPVRWVPELTTWLAATDDSGDDR